MKGRESSSVSKFRDPPGPARLFTIHYLHVYGFSPCECFVSLMCLPPGGLFCVCRVLGAASLVWLSCSLSASRYRPPPLHSIMVRAS